jgi:IBR domain, a half RING-finger domain/RING-type zinc-finger
MNHGIADQVEWRGSGGFECSICLDTLQLTYGVRLLHCLHWYCKECLQRYVASKLSDKTTKLTCPDTSCRTPLHMIDIQSCTIHIGDTRLWNEYEELATQLYLDKATTQNKSTRRCPAANCNYIFEFEPDLVNGNGKLFICPECNSAFCLNCPVVEHKVGPAHDGGCRYALYTMLRSKEEKRKLEEWKQLNEEADNRFNELLHLERVRGITKPCPKCQAPITKNRGCDHMRCLNCNLHFSWAKA